MVERERTRRRSLEPLPKPDFDNPIPFDGYPSPEDTELMRDLQHLVLTVQAWVTAAYVTKPSAQGAAELASLFTDTGTQLTAYAVTLVR